jgi:hypothetical protein
MISEIILKRITTLISNAIREDDGDHASSLYSETLARQS